MKLDQQVISFLIYRINELEQENKLLYQTSNDRLHSINTLSHALEEKNKLLDQQNKLIIKKEDLINVFKNLLHEKESIIENAKQFISQHIKYRLKNQINHKLKNFLIPKLFKQVDLNNEMDHLKKNEIIQTFLNFSKESDQEVQLLQDIAIERYELIQRLHNEVNSNKNINIIKLLLKQLNEFLENLNTFYDTLQKKFFNLNTNSHNSLKEYEIVLKQIHSLVHETIIQYQDLYKKISYNKERSFIHDYQHRTFKERIEKIKALIKSGLTPKLGTLMHYPPRIVEIPERYQKKFKNTDKLPLISLVTPTFNQGIYLGRTINSIIGQDYDNLEYIIQDGGSNDSTLEIIKTYRTTIKHWESVKDKGQSNALNLGFSHTTGEIMAYLNSDDLLLPGALHYIGNYFRKHPKVDVIYGHRILINEKDQEIGRWILPPHDSGILSWADYIPQETLFWRRRLWEKAGGYIDENYCFAMDWDLLLRFRDVGARFVRLPRFIGAFRIHPNQKTSANIIQTGMEEMQRLRARCHKRNTTYSEISSAIKSYLYKHVIYHRLYRAGLLRY